MDIFDRIYETTRNKGPAGLQRMERLLELLGNPEEDLRIFHVGGTNGKGSVSFFIKSLLEAEGFSVGMFTSPHVEKYNERFRYSDEMISDEDLERYADMVLSYNEQLNSEGHGNLALFEILTAVAYLYFNERRPDYVIMEVGIGGRIDVTNTIAHPVATVITQVGLDHTDVLGDTVVKIAEDKACIIKRGVPIVTQSPEAEIRDVIHRKAEEMHAPILDVAEMSYEVVDPACEALGGIVVRFNAVVNGRNYEDLAIRMIGEHQIRNAMTALSAVMSVIDISEEAVRAGLLHVINPGRFEFLQYSEPCIVIDGAHNPSGIAAAIDAYRKTIGRNVDDNKLLLVFGCLKDKECDTMVSMLAEAFGNADFLMLQPDSDRALPAHTLGDLFEARGCKCEASEDTSTLFDTERLAKYDNVLVLGSIYLIGEIKTKYISL
ncbi:MAG: bifunctional folylpolyglutamate synthase/dihydrofolate synthase [Firmicutes bacterium]|nr:bifunctional folylpolyglutamate synthase/dihydrofolate synthase [Bacillota bacterium]